MKLNTTQRDLVSNNLLLVHKVIHDRVHNPQQLGIFSYEDLFQIGCLGLCKAAATDKGGVFSTYAYRLIWNEICSALQYASFRSSRELLTEVGVSLIAEEDQRHFDADYMDMESLLYQAEIRATGVTAKGIQALKLTAKGYTCREVSEMMDVPVNHVTAWIAKARKFLRSDPAFMDLIAAG